jgi:hypothetical protein
MKPKLEKILFDAYHHAYEANIGCPINREDLRTSDPLRILVSEVDRDPYVTVGPPAGGRTSSLLSWR